MITLQPKKTASERVVKIRPITYEAVKEYFDSLFPQPNENIDASRKSPRKKVKVSFNEDPLSTMMFDPGANPESSSKWCTNLKCFFKSKCSPSIANKIQSHCFRVTRATEMYEKHKDIARVQKYLGHRNI